MLNSIKWSFEMKLEINDTFDYFLKASQQQNLSTDEINTVKKD